jgi:hypothetical protein
MISWLLGAALLFPVYPKPPQDDLRAAGESARLAWQRHDMAALVQSSSRVLVQLPGAEPSAPVSRQQAAVLLTEQVQGFEEVSVQVQSVRELEGGRGVVELARVYRVAGTTGTRKQSVLLVYRRGGSRWELLEVRLSG